MKTVSKRAILVLIAAMSVGLTGCATTQVEEAMSMARQAQADATAAREAASKAASAASAAERTAMDAKRAAMAAQSAAESAGNCCAANSEKIERMFKESMRK